MKSLSHKLIYTLTLMLCCLAALAQPSGGGGGQIKGSLQTGEGKPADFATVSLLNAKDSSIVKGALSNEAGAYAFNNVKQGSYLIKATSVGYDKAVSAPFQVTGNGAVTVPVLKLQSAAKALQAVTVTATKPLIERKTDRTVMNVENSVLAAGNSAMDILERAPGVSVDKDDNISMNGKQGVTVMINDKLTYLSSAQLATLLRSTDGTTIQSIELITNPSAKYDAAGNSGIINIKLKKNKQTGTNGSLSETVAYSGNWRESNSLNINHKDGALNVFGSFSHGDIKRTNNLHLDRLTKDSTGRDVYFSQHTLMPNTTHYNNYRFGADYETSSKNTLGFVVNGYDNSEYDYNDNQTRIGGTPAAADSSLHTISTFDQTYKNFAANLNDQWKIDTLGQQLNVDLDYSKFTNTNNDNYNTQYYLPDGSIQHAPQILMNQTPSLITIYTAKFDYTKPLGKGLKLEAGAKYSNVKTDNNLQAQIYTNGAFINDTTRTNHFIYDEKVDAGYLNLSKQFKKTSIQFGLRAEYTQSNGDLIGSTPVDRHYLDFFPSAFINHTINDKNEISFSYSRRIDRPSYDNLNPFIYYLDPYTFNKGNAFLNPQYTNNFELNYTWNKSITLTLGYAKTTDVITEVILTEGEKSFQTNLNLQTQNSYNININAPYTIAKWWTGTANFTGFYLGFKSDTVANGSVNTGRAAFQIRSTQTFLFSGYKAEVTGNYNSPLAYGIYNIGARYGIDGGVSKSFFAKKLNVKVSCDDIFKMQRNDVSSHVLGNDFTIHQVRDSRVGRITLTWNFGNNKFQVREHQTGADDEKNRVKGN